MPIYLILALIIVVLIAAVFVMVVILKDSNEKINELKNDNKVLNDNVMCLVKYSDLINKIRKEKEEVNNELLQAKDAEEINDIISGILSNNNNRVRE